MTLYKKIPALNYLIPELTNLMNQELTQRGTDNVVVRSLGFLHTPTKLLNNLLMPLGFPALKSCILFSRAGGVLQNIHIDNTSAAEFEIVNCAINFPIENCNNYMYWYQGVYDVSPVATVDPGGITRKYSDLIWHTGPQEIDKTIIDVPTLVNVSVPHNIQRVPEHRKILTFRFVDNPSYDKIAELIDLAWPAKY
jgi:hypothetical protein